MNRMETLEKKVLIMMTVSIYLISRGMRDKFDGEQIEGKKVLIQSDGIFIKGRQEVKLIETPNLSVIKDEVKLGSK